MATQKYYVSVGNGEVYSHPVGSYEFEIDATPAQAAYLSQLFKQAKADSSHSFFQFRSFEQEKNHPYDQTLSSIYQTIHDLGDDSAKEHIDTMEILH